MDQPFALFRAGRPSVTASKSSLVMDQESARTGSDLEKVTDQIEEGIRAGKYTWRDIQKAVVTKTRQAATTTDHYARENPWKVVGMAAGLGFVLGLLLAPQASDE